MPEPFPTAVDLDRGRGTLEITWDDGRRSAFTAGELRWACPCAHCRGEMGSPGELDLRARAGQNLDPSELQLDSVSLVGSYALNVSFASGHSTGIYTFRYLRSLDEGRGRASREQEPPIG